MASGHFAGSGAVADSARPRWRVSSSPGRVVGGSSCSAGSSGSAGRVDGGVVGRVVGSSPSSSLRLASWYFSTALTISERVRVAVTA